MDQSRMSGSRKQLGIRPLLTQQQDISPPLKPELVPQADENYIRRPQSADREL